MQSLPEDESSRDQSTIPLKGNRKTKTRASKMSTLIKFLTVAKGEYHYVAREKKKSKATIHNLKKQKLISGWMTFVNQFVLRTWKRRDISFKFRRTWFENHLRHLVVIKAKKNHGPPLNNIKKVMSLPKIALKIVNLPPNIVVPRENEARS